MIVTYLTIKAKSAPHPTESVGACAIVHWNVLFYGWIMGNFCDIEISKYRDISDLNIENFDIQISDIIENPKQAIMRKRYSWN